jgi:hypothetical protein
LRAFQAFNEVSDFGALILAAGLTDLGIFIILS